MKQKKSANRKSSIYYPVSKNIYFDGNLFRVRITRHGKTFSQSCQSKQLALDWVEAFNLKYVYPKEWLKKWMWELLFSPVTPMEKKKYLLKTWSNISKKSIEMDCACYQLLWYCKSSLGSEGKTEANFMKFILKDIESIHLMITTKK